MKFSEAVLLLEQGKSVRRRAWTKGSHIYIDPLNSLLYMSEGRKDIIRKHIPADYLLYEDWEEIVTE